MTAPRWIDKLRGLLQRDETGSAEPTSSADDPATAPGIKEEPSASTTSMGPASASLRPAGTPRPSAPAMKILDSRALAEMGLRQLTSVANHFLKDLNSQNAEITPGLEHDTGLLLAGYAVVSAAIRKAHGEAGNEALRTLRSNVKAAMLGALRKHYHRMAAAAEAKLGANMVTFVDELIALADSIDPNAPHPFVALYPRMASAFGGEAGEGELNTRFGRILQSQLEQVIREVAKAQ